jgi:hypothetical protein
MANRKDCIASDARTPGPWRTAVGLARVRIINDSGITIASTPCLDRQADADARLLAAAPELLEQLIATKAELVRLWGQSSGEEATRILDTMDRASFAIDKAVGSFAAAKAEGRS